VCCYFSLLCLRFFRPFFCNPLKPALNLLWGDGYEIGYAHFRRDHNKASNLVMHLVCLGFQIFANFALMAVLDQHAAVWLTENGYRIPAFAGVPLSLVSGTAVAWSASLLLSAAPWQISIMSTCLIYTAVRRVAFGENTRCAVTQALLCDTATWL
jgi:hypothetical protein